VGKNGQAGKRGWGESAGRGVRLEKKAKIRATKRGRTARPGRRRPVILGEESGGRRTRKEQLGKGL